MTAKLQGHLECLCLHRRTVSSVRLVFRRRIRIQYLIASLYAPPDGVDHGSAQCPSLAWADIFLGFACRDEYALFFLSLAKCIGPVSYRLPRECAGSGTNHGQGQSAMPKEV